MKVEKNWKNIKKTLIEIKKQINSWENFPEHFFICEVAFACEMEEKKLSSDNAIISAIDRSDRGWLISAEIMATELGSKKHPMTQFYRIPKKIRMFSALLYLMKQFKIIEELTEREVMNCD